MTILGADMWNKWAVDGEPKPKDSFIRPWLDQSITITGFELMKLRQYPSWYGKWIERWFGRDGDMSFFAIGSTIVPDAELWLGPNETHSMRLLHDGNEPPWPAASQAKRVVPNYDASGQMTGANGDLIDLHGRCFGGGHVTMFLTIYYKNSASNQPR